FATRNLTYEVNNSNLFSQKNSKQQHYFLDNPNDLKGKKISYSFSYEYTNYYRPDYKCVDRQGNDCFEWRYVNDVPVWDSTHRQKSSWSVDLKVDHNYDESFNLTGSSPSELELLVGREASIKGKKNASINKK